MYNVFMEELGSKASAHPNVTIFAIRKHQLGGGGGPFSCASINNGCKGARYNANARSVRLRPALCAEIVAEAVAMVKDGAIDKSDIRKIAVVSSRFHTAYHSSGALRGGWGGGFFHVKRGRSDEWKGRG